jgi:metal-sulfur cluster biosynthetic enzyme
MADATDTTESTQSTETNVAAEAHGHASHEGHDHDAHGHEGHEHETAHEAGDASAPPTLEELRAVLQTVQDPELHMSIVDLGLVYGIYIDEQGVVTIDLTLTSPACPIGPMIQGQAYHLLTQMDGVEDVEVNLVWDPPWDPKTMASDDVKLMLGIW